LEAATKNKRGRPTVFEKVYGDDGFKSSIRAMKSDDSDRTVTNQLYVSEGLSLAEKVYGKMKMDGDSTINSIFFHNGKGKGIGILEQIGRMHLQNNFDEESCILVLKAAVDAKQDGTPVKIIEKWLRHGRNYNEWK